MKMVYDERYGTVSYAERAAIRKHNVSPFDHDMLCEEIGRTNHKAITDTIKHRSPNGYYIGPPF